MRMSALLGRTRRDAPADADAISHQLLVRAGYIRRVAAGVYSLLPLGLRVLRNIETIVRDELDAIGAQELLLPVLQPIELWEQSGRAPLLDEAYGAFHVEGRGGHFVLGPTHEEVVTAVAGPEIVSYRDLPKLVYQMAVKFRDEARPRFGLLRGREFLMKDAYSFDADADAMAATYRSVVDAYGRILTACGLEFVPVEASSGAFGGAVNHEFMAPSAIGEDRFARCRACGFAANIELGRGTAVQTTPESPPPMVAHHTPGRPGVAAVVEFFAADGVTASGMLKCIAFLDEAGPLVALVPGDREAVAQPGWRAFEAADFDDHPYLVKGYIGPHGLQEHGVRVIADVGTDFGQTWTTGANQLDHHVTGALAGRDFTIDSWAPLTTFRDGDPCPRCGQGIELVQSVEVCHAFQLGNRYSAHLPGGTFRDEAGDEQPLWMGCYGVGLSRLLAVVAEAHHDERGLAWPAAVAPFAVHLIGLRGVEAAAQAIYRELLDAGIKVLFDDREVSAGVKFADADLLGVPKQLVVGAKGIAGGVVEVKDRASGERREVLVESVSARL
jgi:prolyl-tRNA synthetase